MDQDYALALELSRLENAPYESVSTGPASSDHHRPAERAFGSFMMSPRGDRPNEDWTLARALQALEFEIAEDAVEMQDDGNLDPADLGTDFNAKEYRASSCYRQMKSFSTFICFAQVIILIVMISLDGFAPRSENPLIGPSAATLVRWGAKESALIVFNNQWWRLISPIFLHAGIIHIISNVFIQLRVGGYLNIIFGIRIWTWIYISSGIFGNLMSAVFLPESVGVGSSGAVLGMLSAWVVWIIFRWRKIPQQLHYQRNCQLGVVVVSLVITLALSFAPFVDYAAHFGGTINGMLWGLAFLAKELDNIPVRRLVQVVSSSISIALFVYGFYYLAVIVQLDKDRLTYFNENDDWGK